MDIQLVIWIGLSLAVLVLMLKTQPRAWSVSPGWQYRRVFSAGFGGLLFFVAGLIGWDLSHSHGWFEGTKWTDAPIWWQVALGAALLFLAAYWARRVPRQVAR
jgi:hypothetical protein